MSSYYNESDNFKVSGHGVTTTRSDVADVRAALGAAAALVNRDDHNLDQRVTTTNYGFIDNIDNRNNLVTTIRKSNEDLSTVMGSATTLVNRDTSYGFRDNIDIVNRDINISGNNLYKTHLDGREEIVTINGFTGALVNKAEIDSWRGPIAISEYPINVDPNPIITRKVMDATRFNSTQDVTIRQIKRL